MITEEYVVRYIDTDGRTQSQIVEAASADDALKISGIPNSRLISVKKDALGGFITKLFADKPSMQLQAEFLATFAPLVNSGGSVIQSFDSLTSQYPAFKLKRNESLKVTKISEKMMILGFKEEIQLLAEVGERSGTLGEVLRGAADEMIQRDKELGDFKRAVIPPMAIAIFGILTVLLMPLFFVEPVESIMNTKGIRVKTNIAMDVLLWLGHFVPKYWVAMVVGVVAVGIFIKPIFQRVKNLPGLSVVNERFQLTMSYSFITGFAPLISRGMPVPEALRTMGRFARGREKLVFDEMLREVELGGSLSKAFEGDIWHRSLRNLMRGFDKLLVKEQDGLMHSARALIQNQMAVVQSRLATGLGMFGTLLTVGVILIIFFGMTLPLLTIGTVK